MTKLKDNPMDESANPSQRPNTIKDLTKKKKRLSEKKDEKNALGKADPDAFDAKNNNMHLKR